MVDYGTEVVAGVTPGKQGSNVHGIPVFDTVRMAVRKNPADTSVISVPPAMVRGAALEALHNGIRLLVIVTERVPRRDVIEILEIAKRNRDYFKLQFPIKNTAGSFSCFRIVLRRRLATVILFLFLLLLRLSSSIR